MASASSVWCKKLIEHEIFSHLKSRNGDERDGSGTESSEAKNLLEIKDGDIYVWDSFGASLLTTNLRRLNAVDDDSPRKDDRDLPTFQTLRCCRDPANFDIRRITCNRIGSHVALIGSRGVAVLELPGRLGKFGMFDDGKAIIQCRVVNLDERLFLTSNVKILHAEWHPGSLTSLHLTVLTSDNIIRTYSCDDPLTSSWKMSLRPEDSDSIFSPSRLHTAFALGETVVSFDFGRGIEMKWSKTKKRLFLDASKATDDSEGTLWPIYLLRGNGVIYRVLTSFNCLIPSKYQLCGPLRMHPPAEDNYGTDACSIAALNTTPEVLVVATADGKLHHCIVLGADESDQPSEEDKPCDVEDNGLRQLLQEPSLYVFESIELELSLTVLSVTTNQPLVDSYFCPIKLHRDSLCNERYHCYHGAGVHSLVLPWTQKFKYFIQRDDADELLNAGIDEHSIVEHVICTKPLPSSPWSPVMGLSLVPDRLINPKLICLTSTMECYVLPLINSYQLPTMELYSEMESASLNLCPSYEPFEHRIRKLLMRSVSNPAIRTNSASELSAQECFELLCRTTQVFRQHYIQKQENAQNEISRRVRLLKETKSQQLKELNSLHELHVALEKRANKLVERHEQASEKQEEIVSRLTHLLTRFESFVPVLSDAEVGWKKEVTAIAENVAKLKSKFKKVNDKNEYQRRVTSGEEELSFGPSSIHGSPLHSSHSFTSSSFSSPRASSRPTKPAELGSTETKRLKTIITQETEAIAKLVEQTKAINISLAS